MWQQLNEQTENWAFACLNKRTDYLQINPQKSKDGWTTNECRKDSKPLSDEYMCLFFPTNNPKIIWSRLIIHYLNESRFKPTTFWLVAEFTTHIPIRPLWLETTGGFCCNSLFRYFTFSYKRTLNPYLCSYLAFAAAILLLFKISWNQTPETQIAKKTM